MVYEYKHCKILFFESGFCARKLTIYPNGVLGKKDNEHIPVYLSIVDEKFLPLHWSADAVFSFFLYNHKLKNYLCFRGRWLQDKVYSVWLLINTETIDIETWLGKTSCFNANTRNCGFSKLISKKILTDPSSGYLVDDICVFGAEVSIIIVNFLGKIQDPCYRDWLISRVSKLGDVWTSEIFSSGSRQWYLSDFYVALPFWRWIWCRYCWFNVGGLSYIQREMEVKRGKVSPFIWNVLIAGVLVRVMNFRQSFPSPSKAKILLCPAAL